MMFTLEQLSHFNRCMFPDDFEKDLISKGIDPAEAFFIKRWIIKCNQYNSQNNNPPIGILQVYQEYGNILVKDAIERILIDFVNKYQSDLN